MNSLLDRTSVFRYDYTVKGIGQRTEGEVSGQSFDRALNPERQTRAHTYRYGYDALGQVVYQQALVTQADASLKNRRAEGRIYQFDGIGNRTSSYDRARTRNRSHGDAVTYSSNALNQYTSINGQSTQHDESGNLLQDPEGRAYAWDGENRLLAALPDAQTQGRYHYDYLSRRYRRDVKTNEEIMTQYTIYDGWNPVAHYEGNSAQTTNLATSYTWGSDLSGAAGDHQGAGGVGGLLEERNYTTAESYYPTYDGNGNVSEYLDATGEVVAHYEYDAFGKLMTQDGALAESFEHKFSTKRQDEETGLYYYGYRYYDANIGRWLNRDPIEELGGYNIYGFIGNATLVSWDYLGLRRSRKRPCCGGKPLPSGKACCGGVVYTPGGKKGSKKKCCKNGKLGITQFKWENDGGLDDCIFKCLLKNYGMDFAREAALGALAARQMSKAVAKQAGKAAVTGGIGGAASMFLFVGQSVLQLSVSLTKRMKILLVFLVVATIVINIDDLLIFNVQGIGVDLLKTVFKFILFCLLGICFFRMQK